MHQKFRLTLIIGVLILGVLETSGYSGWKKRDPQTSSGPSFVILGGLPVGTAGQPYQFKFDAIGGAPPYTFSSFSGLAQASLPGGLTLDLDGTLSGIPDTSGQYYPVGFMVTDSKGQSTTVLLSMDILTPEGVQGVRRLMLSGAKGDYIAQGTNLFYGDNDGPWIAFTTYFTTSGEPAGVTVRFTSPVNAPDPNTSSFWDVSFSTNRLGVPLTAGVYDNAQRYPFEEAGHPGFDVSGDGRGCNMETGTFTINTISFDPAGNLETLDATFTQYCEIAKAPPLTGHIIYGLALPAAGPDQPTINTVTYNPKKGKMAVEVRHINHQCALLVDGHGLPIDLASGITEKVGLNIKVRGEKLSPGVHQLRRRPEAGWKFERRIHPRDLSIQSINTSAIINAGCFAKRLAFQPSR